MLTVLAAFLILLPGGVTRGRATIPPRAATSPRAQNFIGAPAVKAELTPVSARTVARRWFILRDAARFDNDDAVMRNLETGVALQVDLAYTRRIECGCEPAKHLHTLRKINVVVPGAHSRVFLAQFGATASNGVAVQYTVFFTQVAATWRAALVALDFHQAAIRAPAHGPITISHARRELIDTAAYFTRWRVLGRRPPSRTRWVGYAKGLGAQWAAIGENNINHKTGIHRRYSVKVGSSAYAMTIAGGKLNCGVMNVNDVAWVPGHPLLQDSQRHNWGTTVAPGTYPTLLEQTTLETCVISHQKGLRDLLTAYGTETNIRPGPQAIT